ncbi:MAG TPA: peptidoglycan-binding protein [Candidatus Paceibacterota bacterium]|nr:peptidoglycan-binding protein [Candidatus Paceibacterota bacterium]
MRYLTGLLAVALFALPLTSSAATAAELQAQIQTLLQQISALQAQLGAGGTATTPVVSTSNTSAVTVTTNSPTCPQIGRILSIGSSGDDVTRLQQFLARDPSVYPEAQVSGYYGTLTAAAVGRWQAKYNIISSGTAATTGYGQVGPRTAAAMSLQCSTGSTGVGGATSGTVGTGVAGGYIQVSPITGSAPLNVKVTATVNTAGSCSGGTYVLSWGDGSVAANIGVPAGQCGAVVQNYAHQYIYGGTYIITLSAGAHSTSATVVVSGAGAPSQGGGTSATTPTLSASPTSGTAPLAVTFSSTVYQNGYTIDFGDGTNSAFSQSLQHTYSSVGSYSAKIKQNGTQVGSAVTITTTQGAYPPFAITPNVGGNQLAVSISFDLSGCPAFSLAWGDGTGFSGGGTSACSATSPTYSHIYQQAGAYTIKLVRGAQTDTAALTISN